MLKKKKDLDFHLLQFEYCDDDGVRQAVKKIYSVLALYKLLQKADDLKRKI